MKFKNIIRIMNMKLPAGNLREKALAGFALCTMIILLLLIFQPFGTFRFRMNYKTLFLMGYGFLAGSLYFLCYYLLFSLIPRWFNPARWTLARELSTLLPILLIIATAAYFYRLLLIGHEPVIFSDLFYFWKISLAVALFPFSILIGIKTMKTRYTRVENATHSSETTITIDSLNKKEKSVVLSSNKLIYIKSNGNYIEIVWSEDQAIRKQLLRQSLNGVESQLTAYGFVKVHRSFLVNRNYFEALILEGSSYILKLKADQLQLPVSRSMVKELRDLIG